MKRTPSLIVGGILSLSLIAAGSPAAHAVTTPTMSPVAAEASAYAKNSVKVTLIHDDNDGRVSAGARTVLKGKVTGERAGQTVYLEEKVRSGGKSRWKVIDRIRHNGRFSFTVTPEHGSHEFRARVKTKGVKGTGPVMTRSKVAAPTGGDATSDSVTVAAATVFGLYVQNSTDASGPGKRSDITFNYGVADTRGATDPQSIDIDACPTSSYLGLKCGPAGGAFVKVRVPQEAAVAWSITATSGLVVDNTYYPKTAGSACPAGLFTDSSVPFASIVITNPNTYGYMAHIQTKAGSCDVELLTKAELKVASVVDAVEDWCSESTGMKFLCGAIAVTGVAAAIYFSGGAAAEEGGEALVEEAADGEARVLFDIDAEPINRAASLPDQALQRLLGEEGEIAVNDNGIVEGWADNSEDLGQGFDEDDEPFQEVKGEVLSDGADTLWPGDNSSDILIPRW